MKFLYDTIACPDNNPSCLSGDMRVAKLVYDDATTNVNITYYSYDASGNVMATYDRTITRTSVNATKRNYTDTYKTEELQVYGAKRLGVQLGSGTIVAATITQTISGNSDLIERMQGFSWSETNPMAFDNTKRVVNDRYYEMANHLGNVLVVVSDRKIEYNNLDYYTADVVSYSDYSPYGTLLDGRHGQQQNADYRYGFNGMEADDEIKNDGNSYTTEFRQYDPRLGRWLSLDPLMAKYPGQSPYAAFNNNPIYFADPTGLEGENPTEHSEGKEVENAPKSNSLSFDEGEKHPFTNYNVKIAGRTGTITLYTQEAKNIFVSPEGYLQSFEIYDNEYFYSTNEDGDFNGFRTREGVLYSGNSVFSNVPWHYQIEERTEDSWIQWTILSGNIRTEYGKWKEEKLETRTFQVFLGITAVRMTKTQAFKWAAKKFSKFGSLTDKQKEALAAALSISGLSEFEVESRRVINYRTSHEWYGRIATSITGNSYIVPTGIGKAKDVRVGYAKIQWRVLWQDIDLGIIGTDIVGGMLDTTISAGPPKADNEH